MSNPGIKNHVTIQQQCSIYPQTKAPVGAVGTSPICQGTQRHLAHQCVKTHRSQSWLWTLQWPVNQLQPLPAVVKFALEKQCRWQWSTDNRAFVKVRSPAKKLHQANGAKNMILDALEKIREKVWLHLHKLSPTMTQLSAERDLLSPQFLLCGESESLWVGTWFPRICRMLWKRPFR